jgi:hypothetical protein
MIPFFVPHLLHSQNSIALKHLLHPIPYSRKMNSSSFPYPLSMTCPCDGDGDFVHDRAYNVVSNAHDLFGWAQHGRVICLDCVQNVPLADTKETNTIGGGEMNGRREGPNRAEKTKYTSNIKGRNEWNKIRAKWGRNIKVLLKGCQIARMRAKG